MVIGVLLQHYVYILNGNIMGELGWKFYTQTVGWYIGKTSPVKKNKMKEVRL